MVYRKNNGRMVGIWFLPDLGPSLNVAQSQSKTASWKCPGEADTDGDNCISEEESVPKIAWMSIPVGLWLISSLFTTQYTWVYKLKGWNCGLTGLRCFCWPLTYTCEDLSSEGLLLQGAHGCDDYLHNACWQNWWPSTILFSDMLVSCSIGICSTR